jgi:hypothetical protein
VCETLAKVVLTPPDQEVKVLSTSQVGGGGGGTLRQPPGSRGLVHRCCRPLPKAAAAAAQGGVGRAS